MDDLAVGPDGTVWLQSSYERLRNEANPGKGPILWALGRPGVRDDGPAGTLVPLADGSLLIISDQLTRFDGRVFMPDDGPKQRRLAGDATSGSSSRTNSWAWSRTASPSGASPVAPGSDMDGRPAPERVRLRARGGGRVSLFRRWRRCQVRGPKVAARGPGISRARTSARSLWRRMARSGRWVSTRARTAGSTASRSSSRGLGQPVGRGRPA